MQLFLKVMYNQVQIERGDKKWIVQFQEKFWQNIKESGNDGSTIKLFLTLKLHNDKKAFK